VKTVTVWCWDPNFNGFSMQQAANVYKAIRPNVTIEIVDIPENIEGKIEAGLQAGGAGLPDIALFQDFVIEKFIQNYPGIFVDLKAEGVDYSKFAQYKVGLMTDGSKIYGIPFDTGSTGLFLRVDFMRDAGLNPDQYKRNMAWDEVIDLGTKIKQSGGKPLLAYDSTSYDFLRILVQSTGTQFFKPDGSLNFRTPACRKSLEYMKKMNDGGLFYTTEGMSFSNKPAPWVPSYRAVAAPTTPPTMISSTKVSPCSRTSRPGWRTCPRSTTRRTIWPCAIRCATP
jgi:lactose/L-arabinose transport system substrate-binding protein